MTTTARPSKSNSRKSHSNDDLVISTQKIHDEISVLIERIGILSERSSGLVLGGIDQMISLVKFFISLAATGVFAGIGIDSPNFKSELVLVVSLLVVFFFVCILAVLLWNRKKVTKPYIEQFTIQTKLFTAMLNFLKLKIATLETQIPKEGVRK